MKSNAHKTPFAALLCYLLMSGGLISAAYFWSAGNSFLGLCGLGAAIPFYLGGQVIDWLARQHEAAEAGNAALDSLIQETRKLTSIQREQAERAEVKEIAASVRAKSD